MAGIVRLAVVAALVLCAGICSADDRADGRLARDLMEKSGLNAQLEQVPQFVQAGMDRKQGDGPGLGREDYDRISGMVRSVFDPKTIQAAVQAHLESNLSRDDMRAALAWLDSPLGKRITRLEEGAATPAAYAEMQSVGQKLLDENAGTARLAKIRRLDDAIRATEASTNTVLNVQTALLSALSAAMEADRRPSYPDVRDFVLRNKPEVRAAMERSVRVQFLYTYREVTDFELDRYIGFAESKAGRRYHLVTTDAVDGALVQAARRLGSRLGMRMDGI